MIMDFSIDRQSDFLCPSVEALISEKDLSALQLTLIWGIYIFQKKKLFQLKFECEGERERKEVNSA